MISFRIFFEDKFNTYISKVYPMGVSEIQYNEIKQAFYAGIQILFHDIMTSDALTKTIFHTEEYFKGIDTELKRYFEERTHENNT